MKTMYIAGQEVPVAEPAYATDFVPVTPSANPTYDPPVLVYMVSDGALEVVTDAGTTRTYPEGTFSAQSVVPLRVTQIRSGTTAGVYAVRLE